MDRIDEALNCVWENDSEELAETARAELAALRATVEAQARRLEEAREFAEFVADQLRYDKDHYLYINADAWLATNAPAQAEKEQAG